TPTALAWPAKSLRLERDRGAPSDPDYPRAVKRRPMIPGLSRAALGRDSGMLDELDRLRSDKDLHRLLAHYAALGESDHEAWQDRVMEMDGVPSGTLTRLHGELLAHFWIEQNVGVLLVVRAGALPQSYRVTTAGLRALRKSQELNEHQEVSPPIAA
ncbi:MAG TPA: hypothetical protein VKE94_03230, partial [Gemmataceae bacterium]|nr:hypothetical protein [Gemmataceae bacterium]